MDWEKVVNLEMRESGCFVTVYWMEKNQIVVVRGKELPIVLSF